MINLRNVVRGAITGINNDIPAVLHKSTGYTVLPGGIQQKTFTDINLTIQVQPVSSKDLAQFDWITQQDTVRAVYLNQRALGLVRYDRLSGDVIEFDDNGQTKQWRLVQPLEQWSSWTKVLVVMQ